MIHHHVIMLHDTSTLLWKVKVEIVRKMPRKEGLRWNEEISCGRQGSVSPYPWEKFARFDAEIISFKKFTLHLICYLEMHLVWSIGEAYGWCIEPPRTVTIPPSPAASTIHCCYTCTQIQLDIQIQTHLQIQNWLLQKLLIIIPASGIWIGFHSNKYILGETQSDPLKTSIWSGEWGIGFKKWIFLQNFA